MPKHPIIVTRGECFTVECAILKNGSSKSRKFLKSLEKKKRAKISSVIQRYADFGHINNPEQFKKVEGKLWEFKAFQVRIFMYHCAPKTIALTHGFHKKKDKIPSSQIKRAERIMLEYNTIRKGLKL